MALTKIVIETEIVGGEQSVNQLEDIKQQAEGSVKSLTDLKKEFKTLQDQLSGLTPGTKEYVDALKRLGAVKDDIGDLRAEIEGFAGADKKIQAFTSVIGGVASGFQAAQGAVALFGSENEDLQKALLKVQAAMAITQGLQGLAGMGDSLKVVSNVLKSSTVGTYALAAAQRVYNAVMAANPIGLLIAGLTALVGVIAIVVNSMEDEDEAQKKVIASREAELAVMDRQFSRFQEESNFRRQLAQAQGKSADEILALNKNLNIEEGKLLQQRINVLKQNIIHRAKIIQNQDDDEKKETIKRNQEDLKQITEFQKRQRELQNQNKLEQEKFDTDERKKAEERQKAANERAKALRDKKAADDLAAAEKWRQEQQKFIQYEIDALNNKFGEEEQIIAEQQLATKIALNYATPEEIQAWNAYKLKQQQDYNNAFDAELKRLKEAEDKRRADADEKIKIEFEAEKKRREEELANRKKAKEQEVKLTLEGLQTVQSLADAFAGKSEESQRRAFNVKKAASIAQATIETYQAAQSAYASQMAIPTPDAPVRAAIAAGISIASGLARVAVIAKQKFEAPSTGGGGGGGGGNLGSFSQGGGGGGQPPQGLTAQNTVTQINPDGTVAGQGNQQPMKAYVVESESRAVTERVNKLSNNSKIG
jgi:hypothetical protein